MTDIKRAVIGIVVLAAAGCGPGSADVTGKVTYKGKPVVCGAVVIVGADGLPKSGLIQPDGTFRVEAVRVGPARVAVTSPPPASAASTRPKARGGRDAGGDGEKTPPPQAPPADPEVVKNWVSLPEKYGDPTQSGLTIDVPSAQPVTLALD
jgi:hypothetical protein